MRQTSYRSIRNISALLLLLFVSASFIRIPPTLTGYTLAASREPVRARHGIVASTNEVASRVGVDIMKRGGNAVDAAIAVAFALAVTHPAAGNLGGGGFMMIRLKNGKTTAIDYREMAPAAAHRNVYLDKDGNVIKGEGGPIVGYRAAGVPGTVRGMELALKKYGSGKLSWAQLVEPARRLAANGFRVTHSLSRSLRGNDDYLSKYAETKRIYLNNGKFYNEGDLFVQTDLGATFARLQQRGPNEFYEGQTARMIVDDLKRNNGLITLADMRGYVAKEREPVRGTYRGYEIVSMPPPSSGGAVLIQMLNILEGYDLKKVDWASSDRYHLMTESMRRAFADRAEYMGDTDFVKV
ncbi:MAG: gamma-glutamyltransferase, partial [Pyrinomonadaceae bacterium]